VRRGWGAALRAGLVLLTGATLVQAGPARAEDGAPVASIGGFDGTAAASGLRVLYNPAGVLPIPAPVDLSSPDALATIASGPSTYARAAVADPGDLLANPDALLTQASSDYPEGAIPKWPLRIEVSSAAGAPSARSAPAPGLTAAVSVADTASEAEATTPRVDVPAVVTVGSMRAHATTSLDGSTVTVQAESSLSDVDVLGLLTIRSVSTRVQATSDGETTTAKGGTVVSGASLGGQPVTVDADGIHASDGAGLVPSATVHALNQVLGALGIRVTVSSPVEQEAPTAGQLLAGGLRIDLEVSDRTYPQIGDLLDQLPPLPTLVPGAPGLDDVLALARAQHLATVAVGQAQVNLGVRSFTNELQGSDDVPLAFPSDIPGSFAIDPIPSSSGDAPVASGPIVRTADEAPPAGFAEGIGLLAVLGLLLQPLLADRISRGAAFLLAADPNDSCPREGT
jgi:hypothetical protein